MEDEDSDDEADGELEPLFELSLLSYKHRHVLTKAQQNYDNHLYFLRE